MGDDSAAQHVAAAVQAHTRRRVQWERETAIAALLSDPAFRDLREAIAREEARLGLELRPRFQAFQDRYDQAVREGDVDVLQRTCPGKHGRFGRLCVLDAGHEATGPHWGINAEGEPVAWVGSAPDDN